MARKPADQSVSRDDIIGAAADVLHRKGYDATTMKDIAAQINLTAASLYHHFHNKDMLLLAVLEGGIEYVIADLEPIVRSQQSNHDKLRQMIKLHVTGITENTGIGVAMIFEIRQLLNPQNALRNGQHLKEHIVEDFVARRDAFFDRRHYFEELFEQVIRDGIAAGEFHPVDENLFTKAILGAQNWVAVWYKPGGRLNGEAIAERMADDFLRALNPQE